MLVISPSSPSVMAVTKTAFFRTPLIRPRRSRSGGCFGYAFLGFNGLQTVHSAKPEALVRLKAGAGSNLRAHPAVGPLCSAPLDVGREAADPSAESTAARVGDGMAEWSGCERIADVATAGPAGARLFELTQRGSR
jgi:hypothetical protein